MFYIVSIMILISSLILSVFQTSLPTVYSLIRKDYYRVVNENNWFSAVKFADMQLRVDNWVVPANTQRDFILPTEEVQGEIQSGNVFVPALKLTNKIKVINAAGDLSLNLTTDYNL